MNKLVFQKYLVFMLSVKNTGTGDLLYLGSWRHLKVKIFGQRCILKNFRAVTYIYIEVIYQISAQSDTWNITGWWGQVLAHFTLQNHDFWSFSDAVLGHF